MNTSVSLDGNSLNLDLLWRVAQGLPAIIGKNAARKVDACRSFVAELIAQDKPIYGVNTGFGSLVEQKISPDELEALQHNIILSHACGVGAPLSREETRALMCLRLNVLLKGHSGVRLELCELLLDLLNAGVHPVIPEQGSVGASGDLAPLAHMSLALIGEGTAEYKGKTMPSEDALLETGISPLKLEAKEGLALVNGTQAMAAVGGLAVLDALELLTVSSIAAAMTLVVRRARFDSLNALIHEARGQQGQSSVAAQMREILKGAAEHKQLCVQDPYSLRCISQVHGASLDALLYVKEIVSRELNAGTDNPLAFAKEKTLLSGGNFHGQPLALAFDFAKIASAELGNISERRLEQLLNPEHSSLPAFLSPQPGLNSGLMAAQYLTSSLVNENKVLCTPASVDSIPGNANIEDHVSMGMTSARHLRDVVKNLRTILAVELLAAAQALDFIGLDAASPMLKRVYQKIRDRVPPLNEDRIIAHDVEALRHLIHRSPNQAACSVIEAAGLKHKLY